jgi:hypothetical protein
MVVVHHVGADFRLISQVQDSGVLCCDHGQDVPKSDGMAFGALAMMARVELVFWSRILFRGGSCSKWRCSVSASARWFNLSQWPHPASQPGTANLKASIPANPDSRAPPLRSHPIQIRRLLLAPIPPGKRHFGFASVFTTRPSFSTNSCPSTLLSVSITQRSSLTARLRPHFSNGDRPRLETADSSPCLLGVRVLRPSFGFAFPPRHPPEALPSAPPPVPLRPSRKMSDTQESPSLEDLTPEEANRIIHSHRKVRYGKWISVPECPEDRRKPRQTPGTKWTVDCRQTQSHDMDEGGLVSAQSLLGTRYSD